MVTLSYQDDRDRGRRKIAQVDARQLSNWLLLRYVWERGVRRIRQYGSPAHHGRGTQRPLVRRLPGLSPLERAAEGAEPLPEEEPEQADAQRCRWPCPACRSAVLSAVAWRRPAAQIRMTRDQLRQFTLPFR